MTTTPTIGAAIQRYKIGYREDEWGQRSSTPSGIPDASGSWVRYEDHVTALAAGQATAAQGVADAALPDEVVRLAQVAIRECQYKGNDMPQDWMESAMRACRLIAASHGQAPATQQAGVAKEHVRLVRVIADKIEDGTLFQSGIYSNKDLARFVRNVADAAAPQFPTTQAQADSVQEDAARYRWLREGNDAKHGAAWHVAVNLYGCEWDAAIDAARKQGASHDR